MKNEVRWPDADVERLRMLWMEGHSTAEIGRRMDRSKNSIVGRAHRLHLTPRPTPIRPRDPNRQPAPRRVVGPTLPPLEAVVMPAERHTVGGRAIALNGGGGQRPAVGGVTLESVQAAPKVIPRHIPPPTQCCWPLGEPGTKGFTFCTSNARGGKPYCGEHAAIAYVRVQDRRETADDSGSLTSTTAETSEFLAADAAA